MTLQALLLGTLTLGAFLFFYASAYLSIPRERRRPIADALPVVLLLIMVAMTFAGTVAWLAFDGGKGAAVTIAAGGVVAASLGQKAVRKRLSLEVGKPLDPT